MAIIVEPTGTGWQRFRGSPVLSAAKVSRLVDTGTWGMSDLAYHGLIEAVPFVVPEGMVRVGSERFEAEAGHVVQVFDVEPAPDPLEAEREAAVMGKAEFLFALTQPPLEIITEAEAKAAQNSGAIPALFAPILAGMPSQMRLLAELKWGDAEVSRNNDLLVFAADALFDEQGPLILDQLFGIGVQP